MITVKQLLEKKGHDVWSITSDSTVFECIKQMDEKHVGALTVVNKNSLVGVISERDYARKVILKGLSSKETKVKDIMTKHVYHTVPDQTIDECLVMMNKHRVRHLPAVDNGTLIGMISIGDVVKEIIEDQQYTIKQLENYIQWEEAY